MFGAVEAGGTKFRVALLDDALDVVDETRVDTTDPEPTIAASIDFLRGHDVVAVGIAAFGPLDLRAGSPTHGFITETPKPDWSHTPLAGPFAEALGVPVGIQTDVEGAAMAEYDRGAGQGCGTLAYMTVGTGIGAAYTVDGVPHSGHGHSEIGHIPVVPRAGDIFAGVCPYHGNCLEGMASGTAIAERWQAPAEELLDDREVWETEAGYLAQAVRTLTYTVAPDRFILGGGVSQVPGLLPLIRDGLMTELAGYVTDDAVLEDVEGYVVAAGLAQDAGLIGAGLIARRAAA